MPSGSITFKGTIIDAKTTPEEMFIIKNEPFKSAEFPFHIYDKVSGQFKSAHATLEIATQQRNNFYNAIMNRK